LITASYNQQLILIRLPVCLADDFHEKYRPTYSKEQKMSVEIGGSGVV